MSRNPDTKTDRAKRSPLEDLLEDLSRGIGEWLEDASHRGRALQRIISETRAQPLLSPNSAPVATLAEFARDVDSSPDQAAVLSRLVDGASILAPRIVLFVIRGGAFHGWAGRGLEPSVSVRAIVLPLSADSVLRLAANACSAVREGRTDREGDSDLRQALGAPAPREMLAVPLWVRDRVAAVLYADTSGEREWFPDALGVITALAALSLEALPSRARHPKPVKLAAKASERPPGPAVAPGAQAEPAAPRHRPAPVAHRDAEKPAAGAIPGRPADEDLERLRDQARRFARLLVSEIVLYNAKDIEEGRRSKDLYKRLREEIDRSRRMYEQRIPQRLAGDADYFRDELIKTLAGGDESALSLPWP